MRVGDEHLTFEVQTTLLGLIKRSPQSHRIHLTDLDEVQYKRGLMRDRLTLRTQPFGKLLALPGASEGGLCLCVERSHRNDLHAILDRLHLWRKSTS